VESAITSVDWHEVSVRPDTSLKEALSRMLGLGFRSISVVDGSGVLLGAVGLADIEKTMTDSDAYIAAEVPARDEDGEAGEAPE
jgi:CBS domain-containing protein